MRDNNAFAQSFEMIGNEMKKSQNIHKLNLALSLKPQFDKNRYNLQSCSEVAAIFSTNSQGVIPDAYLILQCKDSTDLQYMSHMDPNVEPLIYPLFYPTGNQGWSESIRKKMEISVFQGRSMLNIA